MSPSTTRRDWPTPKCSATKASSAIASCVALRCFASHGLSSSAAHRQRLAYRSPHASLPPGSALAGAPNNGKQNLRAARRRLEVVVVIVAVVAVVGQRQPAAPHADDDREHDRDVGAGHAGEEERRDAPLGRDRVGLDDRDGARERHARRGGEREVLEPLAVLELAEREALVLVLAALAGLQRALERGLGARGSATARRRRAARRRCAAPRASPARPARRRRSPTAPRC